MRITNAMRDCDLLRTEFKVNESEQKFLDTFYQVYGYELMRFREGCDFGDPHTKELFEVKNNIFRPSQLLQFRTALYPKARMANLAVDMGDGLGFLMFKPTMILQCEEPNIGLPERLLVSLDCERLLELKFRLLEEIAVLKGSYEELNGCVAELRNRSAYLRMQCGVLTSGIAKSTGELGEH